MPMRSQKSYAQETGRKDNDWGKLDSTKLQNLSNL